VPDDACALSHPSWAPVPHRPFRQPSGRAVMLVEHNEHRYLRKSRSWSLRCFYKAMTAIPADPGAPAGAVFIGRRGRVEFSL
jgi:hypothetical protein